GPSPLLGNRSSRVHGLALQGLKLRATVDCFPQSAPTQVGHPGKTPARPPPGAIVYLARRKHRAVAKGMARKRRTPWTFLPPCLFRGGSPRAGRAPGQGVPADRAGRAPRSRGASPAPAAGGFLGRRRGRWPTPPLTPPPLLPNLAEPSRRCEEALLIRISPG